MRRGALACCALLACKGSPSEDERAPAVAPIAVAEVADAAAQPDAAAAPCFTIPPDAQTEHAGIRRLAHRAAPAVGPIPRSLIATKLVVGKPTRVPSLDYAKGPMLTVPPVGADALVTMAHAAPKGITLTAPAHLEGAVVVVQGKQARLVAIGDAGLITLARYREHYVKARLAKAPVDHGNKISSLSPIAIINDDIDGDGTPELVAYSTVYYANHTTAIELGVLWSTGDVAFSTLASHVDAPEMYLAPPVLSGGTPLLVSFMGDRISIAGKTLVTLPRAEVDVGSPRCLRTSSAEPATLVAKP